MRVPFERDTSRDLPDTELQRQTDEILDRFRRQRNLRPLGRVRAWEGVRAAVQIVTGEEVWTAWRRFKLAQARAQTGGEFDQSELHALLDDFKRLLTVWLNGPAA